MKCEYCSSNISCEGPSDQEFLNHLANEHIDEISKIERRRLESEWDGDVSEVTEERHRFSPLQIGGFVALGCIVLGVLVVNLTGFGGREPSSINEETGTLEVTVNGQPADLITDAESGAFSLKDDGSTWVMNTSQSRLTINESLQRYGVSVHRKTVEKTGESYLTATVDGEVYNSSDAGTEVRLTVNGHRGNPGDDLFRGDNVTLEIDE
jgi:hypothetical protein